ncbi:hypothetical protein LWI29_014939 [Acer saccharum]|uniref:Copper transport protein n=1 Tax=Acer saccharum TaxID=4024 RepID=A0AA39TG71_ACESA|nr:hypothetical protein LWI29_014939 [Acer saccharum]
MRRYSSPVGPVRVLKCTCYRWCSFSALAILVEWLSGTHLIREGTNNVAAGMIQTVMHAIRVGLAYMVMLAVMSFNAGVFLAALAGHTLGFFLFGSRVFKKKAGSPSYQKTSDLPPMSC